jgi:hypothetical protein
MEPLLGGAASQAKFDSSKFAWLGSMNNEVSGFYIRQPGPASTLQQVLAGAPLKVGSTGIGGDQHAFTAALNALLGTKLKAIAGYPGTQEIMLAVERGDSAASSAIPGVALRQQGDSRWQLKIILQLALDKHKGWLSADRHRCPATRRSAGARDDLRASRWDGRWSHHRVLIRVSLICCARIADAMRDPRRRRRAHWPGAEFRWWHRCAGYDQPALSGARRRHRARPGNRNGKLGTRTCVHVWWWRLVPWWPS